jgi:antitoxin component of MazEF toxin-antitoxin module
MESEQSPLPLTENFLQIRVWGDSLAFQLPKHLSDSLGIKANDWVLYQIENGKLILEAYEAQEYTLDQLLSEEIELTEEVNWGEPMGAEVW